MNRPVRRLTPLLAVAALGACDSVDLVPGVLTPADASEVAAAAMFATFNSTSVLPPRPSTGPAGQAAGSGWALDFEAEVRCPGGGMVVLAASLVAEDDGVAGEQRAEYRLAEVHDACGAAPAGTEPFRVSGAPRTEARVSVRHAPSGAVSWAGRSEGSVRWVREGRTGVCAFDITFRGRRPRGGEGAAELVGAVCGLALSDSMRIR